MLAACNFTGIPVPHTVNGFRLSAHPWQAVPAADITATVLNAIAYSGGQIGLLDAAGAGTVYTHPSEVFSTPTLSGVTNNNYDAFAYRTSGGVLALESSAAWTNDTTRANAISYVNGIWVKTSDYTRRWMGTYRMPGVNLCIDSEHKPWVFSADNRVLRTARTLGPTTTFSSAATTYVGIGTSFELTVLVGSQTAARATLTVFVNNTATGPMDMSLGVLVGASSFYDLAGLQNDSPAIQRCVAARDVPLPFGASFFTAVWKMVLGSTGAMQFPAGVRSSIAQAGSCSLQLSYMR